jgi:RND family efflux transporter MFP subunit
MWGNAVSGAAGRWGWLALGLWLVASGCHSEKEGPRGQKLPEVMVARATTAEVIDYEEFTGRLSAIKTVDIRARVSGYVLAAPFREGDRVKAGEVLFQIDDTIYAAALEKAEADVKLYEAQKELLDAQYARASRLVPTGAKSREDFDIIAAQRDQVLANIAAARAQVKTAKQNLDWTRVTAPFSGRISRRYVDPGNLVKADDTILTTLVTEDPIYVYFDVDERTFMDLAESPSPGLTPWLAGPARPVLMRLANEEEFTHAGTVNFVDNQVNGNTGTIRMRGEFANPGGLLKPGLFARVRLPISNPYKAVLVPDEAIQSDQGRKMIYVVDKENKIVYRRVKLGPALGSWRVLREGAAPGERVVVSGMQRVRPGMTVVVKEQKLPPPPESPLRKLFTQSRPVVGAPGAGNHGTGS